MVKRFFEWDKDWKSYIPKQIVIYNNNKSYIFNLGNIMEPSNMSYQITFEGNYYGFPDTFEIDIYKIVVDSKLKLNVEMTCGDFVVFSFSIFNGKVSIIEDSKRFWGTEKYSIDKNTIKELVYFFNKLANIKLNYHDLNFLCPN